MEDLALHILDVAENSLNAGASDIRIEIDEDSKDDLLRIEIRDNGRGIAPDILPRVIDPFYTTRTTRNVGLGLPFLKQAAEEAEGSFSIKSDLGKGTTVIAAFRNSHIDRKPLGNIADTLIMLIAGHTNVDIFFRFRKDDRDFELDTREIREGLGDVPLNAADVLNQLRELIESAIDELQTES